MEGFVYILSNDSMPGIFKIGYTTRHPKERANELFTTGIPSKFITEYYIYVEDCIKIESIIHNNLRKFNCGKEFFKMNLINCILELRKIVNKIFGDNYYEAYKSDKLKFDVENYKNNIDCPQRIIIIDKFKYI